MFKSGNKNILINYLGWNIRPLVCYDLRFPVWSRNTDNFDLVLYVANWPKTRINAWDSLLKARAIENMSYSLGVNRIGEDANNLIYPGHSSCYDFFGSTTSNSESAKLEKSPSLAKWFIELGLTPRRCLSSPHCATMRNCLLPREQVSATKIFSDFEKFIPILLLFE